MSDTTTIDPNAAVDEQESEVLLTESAANEIKDIIKAQELDESKVRLRVGVTGGGCSGFSYMLDLVE